jgi:cytochrome bd-type quinol oxidase subunit 2
MADEFDRYLASALAPDERLPDRAFVARVQSRIAVEEQLTRERKALLASLIKQLVALGAVAMAVWWIMHAAPIADWFAEFPAVGLALLVACFGLLVALLTLRSNEAASPGA